jgi:hypothetical protein
MVSDVKKNYLAHKVLTMVLDLCILSGSTLGKPFLQTFFRFFFDYFKNYFYNPGYNFRFTWWTCYLGCSQTPKRNFQADIPSVTQPL